MNNSADSAFLRAVGGARSLRVAVESKNGAPPRQFDLPGPYALIGCHEQADVQLKSPEISRRQLYLQLIDGRLFAIHLSWRTPTLWRGGARPAGWVDVEDRLDVGPYTLTFPGTPTSPLAALNPLARGSFPVPPVTLELKRGRSGAHRASITRALTLVGNSAVCKLRMNSSRVSSVHCSLVRTAGAMWVVDLAGMEGIRVNGERVRAAPLAEGDQLEIGGRCLVVSYAGPATGCPTGGDDFAFAPTEMAVVSGSGAPAVAGAMGESSPAMAEPTPFLERLAATGPESVDDMRAMMAMMMQAFGAMFAEHRKFIQEELLRFDRLVATIAEQRSAPALAAPAMPGLPLPALPASPPPALPPPPDLSVPLPPLNDALASEQVHAWLQERIAELGEKRASFWQRMAGMLRNHEADVSSG